MDKIRATFTLAGLNAHHACTEGYARLLDSLPVEFPEDQPIPLLKALESNPVADVIWALRAVDQDIRAVLPLLAADFAESVLHIFEEAFPGDGRPSTAIDAARIGGDAAAAAADASADAAAAADASADDASSSAYAAAYAASAYAAAYAAYAAAYADAYADASAAAAADAAYAAAYADAYADASAAAAADASAAYASSYAAAAASAASAASYAASASAASAADAERTKQAGILRKYFTL